MEIVMHKVLLRRRKYSETRILYTIDTELTGLHSFGSPTAQLSLFDNPQERYDKLRPSVTRFTVSQIGLSLFTPTVGFSQWFFREGIPFLNEEQESRLRGPSHRWNLEPEQFHTEGSAEGDDN
ncbi:poly(A)-specific ribonuclease PNLDC1-like isoform X2 [Chiloscyllium punctatum]|uniref:poly(A)-specific ribonuclease PNLDC1-like isoform X2 n=1 Tax=Chiloscyllium punctatum TaxID=137246 RepID=UPI003B63EE8E